MTEAGRLARLAFVDRWEAELRAVDDAALDAGERIDRDLILGELDHARFNDEVLREETWNPLVWVYVLGGGIHPLLAREFAPLAVRLESVAGRLEGIPAVLDGARASLGVHPDRPVSAFMAETAAKRIGGVASLADEAVAAGEAAAAAGDADVAALLPRLRAAAATAAAALDAFRRHLDDDVAPAATGQPDPRPVAVRGQAAPHPPRPGRDGGRDPRPGGARLRRPCAPRWSGSRARSGPTGSPARPAPADEGVLVRRVLDEISNEHPAADELVAWSRDELARVEAFCRERDVIGLVDEPLVIDWTPEFLRSFGGAMLDSPGPLDHGQKSFFSITPVPEDWPPDQQRSYLREMNTRQMQLLVIHEAVPGHYLQGAYANHGSSLARRVFVSGVFAEGWAVYVTQVMLDRGYCAGRHGAVAQPLEVLPAVDREHDHRRQGAHGGHDQRGARRLPRRRRVPGARRGDLEGRAGAAVVDAALDLLRRARSGCGTSSTSCDAGRRWRRARRPMRSPSRASSAATRGRRASTSGPTSRRSSRTAPRRSRSSAGSCSGEG